MCAVCWSSVQLVPAAAVGIRAFYAHRLNRGLDRVVTDHTGDERQEESVEPAPTATRDRGVPDGREQGRSGSATTAHEPCPAAGTDPVPAGTREPVGAAG